MYVCNHDQQYDMAFYQIHVNEWCSQCKCVAWKVHTTDVQQDKQQKIAQWASCYKKLHVKQKNARL